MNHDILLQRYLSAYWLRPVTALVRVMDSMALRLWEAPADSIELACGDGVNSLLARGGSLKEDFDVFETVQLTQAGDFFSGKVDLYDRKATSIGNPVIKSPARWAFACDHKENLLQKAGSLEIYERLEVQDLNEGLPQACPQFSFLFSNSLYWLHDLDPVLRSIHERMKPGGRAKLMIVKDNILDHMAWKKLGEFPFRSLVDMGRHQHYKQVRPQSFWRSKFSDFGFRIVEEIPLFHPRLMHMIEFHDYREISPVLGFMVKRLSAGDLSSAKSEWIKYFTLLFNAMLKDGFLQPTPEESVYTLYHIEKQP